MDLTHVIIGPIVTEKTERRKGQREHAIKVNPKATKIDVKAALRAFYDLDVDTVRMVNVVRKVRGGMRGGVIQKRPAYKKALITLAKDSKGFDLASFKNR